jgi:hypothetical protein
MDRNGLAGASAEAVLDREFLELRARLLEVAAGLDRLGRATGSLAADARYAQIQQAIAVLASGEVGRAESLQLIFSRAYDPEWQRAFGLERPGAAAATQ